MQSRLTDNNEVHGKTPSKPYGATMHAVPRPMPNVHHSTYKANFSHLTL